MPLSEYREMVSRIIHLLEQHAPMAMSVTAIARELKITRATASKYLDLLALNGNVSMRRFGQKKLYRPSPRIPLPEVFDQLSSAIVILDCDLQIRMVNPVFVTMLGIHAGRNIVGTSIYDLDLPVFADPGIRRNIERIQQSQTYLTEIQMIEERTDRVYQVDFASVVAQIGSPAIMVSLRDITALRKAESALKYSEKKIATIFETVPSGIIMFTTDGTILNANRASLQILGLRTFEELNVASVFDISCSPETLKSLIREGKVAETEITCNFDRLKWNQGMPSTKSGVAYFNVVFTPIRPERGSRPKEFAILFKDITRDRKERKELTFREIRYHSFFEDSFNGVIICEQIEGGDEFVFKDLNRAAEHYLGIRRDDLIGRRFEEFYPDLAERLIETAKRVMKTGKPVFLQPIQYEGGQDAWIWHYLFKIPSGEIVSLMLHVSGELGDGGWPPATDITDSFGRTGARLLSGDPDGIQP